MASTASASSDDSGQHAVSLKVIHLSRPKLMVQSPVYFEKQQSTDHATHSLVEGLEAMTIMDLGALHAVEAQSTIQIRDFGVSQLLELPSSFGTIYLGESFQALVSVNNETQMRIAPVAVKIELQTSSQRVMLHEERHGLEAHDTKGIRVSHEIKELGVHILVCSVHYEPRHQFRQFYKFQVSNPLAVKTKINNIADGHVFLEAQVQNVSAGLMWLERLRFEPSEYFTSKDINHDGDQSVFDSATISPDAVRQYLYQLSPRPSTDGVARTTNALGKLDIVWRTAMGGAGRLQTSQLTRKAPLLEDIEAQPESCSTECIVVETPFSLRVRVSNHSQQPMRLIMSAVKAKMGSVLINGISSQPLGDVAPHTSVETDLGLFPLTPGLQRVGGLRIVDLLTGYTKDVDRLCDVFVTQSAPPAKE